MGDELESGSVLAIISDKEDSSLLENKSSQSAKRVSKKAKILLQEHNIDPQSIENEFIREIDVVKYIESISPKKPQEFMEDDVIIIGGGGHAAMCMDIAVQKKINVVGYVDDVEQDDFYNLKYLGNIDWLKQISFSKKRPKLILGIGFMGNLKKRQKLFFDLSKTYEFINLVHPSATVEQSAIIPPNAGIQIMAGAIIGSFVRLEDNTIINSGVTCSHHSYIGHSSHITPGAILAGNVRVGSRVTIGMNCAIFLGVTISDDKIIANLSRIDEDI